MDCRRTNLPSTRIERPCALGPRPPFRSILEAKWNWVFEELGWDPRHEPYRVDGYLPDFEIHAPMRLLVEAKPWHPSTTAPWMGEILSSIAVTAKAPVVLVGDGPFLFGVDGKTWTSLGEINFPGDSKWRTVLIAHCPSCLRSVLRVSASKPCPACGTGLSPARTREPDRLWEEARDHVRTSRKSAGAAETSQ